MNNVLIICVTAVTLVLIAGTLSTIEKCSFYKWKATNPDAFKCDGIFGEEKEN